MTDKDQVDSIWFDCVSKATETGDNARYHFFNAIISLCVEQVEDAAMRAGRWRVGEGVHWELEKIKCAVR